MIKTNYIAIILFFNNTCFSRTLPDLIFDNLLTNLSELDFLNQNDLEVKLNENSTFSNGNYAIATYTNSINNTFNIEIQTPFELDLKNINKAIFFSHQHNSICLNLIGEKMVLNPSKAKTTLSMKENQPQPQVLFFEKKPACCKLFLPEKLNLQNDFEFIIIENRLYKFSYKIINTNNNLNPNETETRHIDSKPKNKLKLSNFKKQRHFLLRIKNVK